MSTDAVPRPRIAVCGIAIESSAWAAHRAGHRDFTVLEGGAVLDRYPFLARDAALRGAAEWVGVLHARSIPGGQVLPEVYADLRDRLVAGLTRAVAAGPLDGVLLDVHGAMGVEGMDDAEGDLVAAVRAVVGPEPLVAAPMDLHGNVSERFALAVDLPTCYRTAPHEDTWETRERSARDLLGWVARRRSGRGRPVRAWVPVPVLLPGERTSTRVDPARGLYATVPGLADRDGVTDVSLWIGYAWADEPRCHATVLATGSDEDAVVAAAEELATRFWDARDGFGFVGPAGSLDEAVRAALAHRAAGSPGPYLVSDSGDNPGAGGSGDVTWTLARLLAVPELVGPGSPRTYVASVFDTAAVESLWEHAIGDVVDVEVGARVDDRVSGPVRLRGELVGQYAGDPDAGRIVVVRVGGLHAVVTEFRKAFHATTDFEAVGLDPRAADVVVTKIGYLEPTLHDLARGWTLALTPGPVDQDLERLGHKRIRRPMHPFDAFPEPPALRARVLR